MLFFFVSVSATGPLCTDPWRMCTVTALTAKPWPGSTVSAGDLRPASYTCWANDFVLSDFGNKGLVLQVSLYFMCMKSLLKCFKLGKNRTD